MFRPSNSRSARRSRCHRTRSSSSSTSTPISAGRTRTSLTCNGLGSSTPRSLVSFILDRSLLLVAGTVLALAWANTSAASYAAFAHAAHFLVNDVGMVLFFGLATKEIVEAVSYTHLRAHETR